MNTEPIISSTRPTAAKVYGRGHVRWGDFVTGALAIPVALLALRETRMGYRLLSGTYSLLHLDRQSVLSFRLFEDRTR
jgi:hypothetical protein